MDHKQYQFVYKQRDDLAYVITSLNMFIGANINAIVLVSFGRCMLPERPRVTASSACCDMRSTPQVIVVLHVALGVRDALSSFRRSCC